MLAINIYFIFLKFFIEKNKLKNDTKLANARLLKEPPVLRVSKNEITSKENGIL